MDNAYFACWENGGHLRLLPMYSLERAAEGRKTRRSLFVPHTNPSVCWLRGSRPHRACIFDYLVVLVTITCKKYSRRRGRTSNLYNPRGMRLDGRIRYSSWQSGDRERAALHTSDHFPSDGVYPFRYMR
jgi:hypothetical protein